MELLFWEHKHEGVYGKGKRMKAYTRTLIGKTALENQVVYMGKEIRVAVCHLHFQVGNKNPRFHRNNDDAFGHSWWTNSKSTQRRCSWVTST